MSMDKFIKFSRKRFTTGGKVENLHPSQKRSGKGNRDTYLVDPKNAKIKMHTPKITYKK